MRSIGCRLDLDRSITFSRRHRSRAGFTGLMQWLLEPLQRCWTEESTTVGDR